AGGGGGRGERGERWGPRYYKKKKKSNREEQNICRAGTRGDERTARVCREVYLICAIWRTSTPLCCAHFVDLWFFQAEDGIRDSSVTGVQTCALPICSDPGDAHLAQDRRGRTVVAGVDRQIGRASCRGRVEISVVAVSFKKRNTR